MNNRDIYLTLLRAAIWGGKFDIPQDVDWDAVIKMAARQSTAPLIYDVLLREAGDGITPMQKMQMRQISMQQMQSQMNLLNVMQGAIETLKTDGFHPVVLKGFGLAALYPNPYLRPSGDIDLFVGAEHFPEACASILHRYPDAYRPDKMIYAGKHYNIEVGENVIETHRVSYTFPDQRRNRIYRRIEAEGMTGELPTMRFDDYEFAVPKPTFNALFVFLHAWHHFEVGGMNLRQMMDWTIVLYHYGEQINKEQLLSYLHQLHMLDAWRAFGWAAVHYLGLPQNEMPFYSDQYAKKGTAVYDMIWNDMLKGREWKVQKNNSQRGSARYWNTFRLIIQKAQWMYPILSKTALREACIHMWAAVEHILYKKDYE
jgi:hypothetical protein